VVTPDELSAAVSAKKKKHFVEGQIKVFLKPNPGSSGT
jgi:hypothetical protein